MLQSNGSSQPMGHRRDVSHGTPQFPMRVPMGIPGIAIMARVSTMAIMADLKGGPPSKKDGNYGVDPEGDAEGSNVRLVSPDDVGP